jgi:hypothetical protein
MDAENAGVVFGKEISNCSMLYSLFLPSRIRFAPGSLNVRGYSNVLMLLQGMMMLFVNDDVEKREGC